MSYDFAALTTEFGRPKAPEIYQAMCGAVQAPAPPTVVAFIDEVNARYGVDVENRDVGFLTVEAGADARGAVLCTSWESVPRNTQTLLELTHEHGLLLYDPQRDRLYDPRGGVGIEVSLGGRVTVPYLTQSLLAEYFDCPEPDGPFLILTLDDDHYAQAYVNDDGRIDVEYRAGGRNTTTPRAPTTGVWRRRSCGAGPQDQPTGTTARSGNASRSDGRDRRVRAISTLSANQPVQLPT